MNLENRGNGSWRVTISDGYAPDGSKIRFRRTIKVDPAKSELSQRRDVEKQAAMLEADYRRKLLLAGNRLPLCALYEEYMENYVRRKGLKLSTKRQYRDLFEGRILPALGKIPVQDLTKRDVNRFYSQLAAAPALTRRSKTGKLSGTMQHKYHTALHTLLAYAVRAGYIAVNPCDQVEPPQKDTGETKWYELKDAARLLDAIDEEPDVQWRLFFYLSLYTGARPGELVALNWSDFSENILQIHASAVFIKGQGTLRQESPKTKRSVRPIQLPPVVMALLGEHRRAQLEYRLPFGKDWPEPDAVFTTDDGRRMCLSTPTHKFKKLLIKHDLPPLTLYGLRHTSASAMIAEGLSVRDVAARLGHAQTSTTLNIYAHAFADANARATEAVSSAFERARQ